MTPLEFTPSTSAVGGSVMLSALVGLVPLILFFVLLGAFKVKTQWCAIISMVAAILVAVVAFGMPFGLSVLSATQGLAFGLAPILYIVIMAVWLYNLTEDSGRSEDVRRTFSLVGRGDMRVQAILIGFCFCGLLEGLAGFGAPVAIATAMVFALGLPPIKGALVVMVGNALSVGFGAMATPVTATAASGMPGVDGAAQILGSTMGRITPMFFCFVPIILLAILDGGRGVRQAWPAAIVAGVGMAGGTILGSNFLSYELTAVFASLLAFALVALLMVVWHPTTPDEMNSEYVGLSDDEVDALKAAGGVKTADQTDKLTGSRIVLGLLPYWLVVLIFAVAKLWKLGVNVPALLKKTDVLIKWPGLYGELMTTDGKVSGAAVYNLQTLSSPGTMLLLTGIIVAIVYGANDSNGRFAYSFGKGIKRLGKTFYDLRWTIVTISSIMALAYVMNFSGQTGAIGAWLANTGAAFAFFSPLLGFIGTAVTGSATSSGALFASLQSTAANALGAPSQLFLAANEIGGGMGKIVSPQNLAIAAGAIKQDGAEAELLRKGSIYAFGLVALLGVVILLANLGPMAWVIAH